MKRICLVICIAFLFALSTFAQNDNNKQTVPAPAKSSYADLLAKLKGGDTSIDFKALRLAYSETKEYSPDGISIQQRKNLFQLLTDKKYNEAIEASEAILKTNYVEINSHQVLAVAYRELGNAKKFDFHLKVYKGLIESIISGLDGKSTSTAFTVISGEEEYDLIQGFGFEVESAAVDLSEKGHHYDVRSVRNPKTNESQKVYFNVDIIWNAMKKMLTK